MPSSAGKEKKHVGIKFEKITEGMTLYDVHSTKMGNTTMSRLGLWEVYVREVDTEKRQVLASWNGNKSRWYQERAICAFRAHPPEWMRSSSSFRARYYCPTCRAEVDEKKDATCEHTETCSHPKAVAWRKKNRKT